LKSLTNNGKSNHRTLHSDYAV